MTVDFSFESRLDTDAKHIARLAGDFDKQTAALLRDDGQPKYAPAEHASVWRRCWNR